MYVHYLFNTHMISSITVYVVIVCAYSVGYGRTVTDFAAFYPSGHSCIPPCPPIQRSLYIVPIIESNSLLLVWHRRGTHSIILSTTQIVVFYSTPSYLDTSLSFGTDHAKPTADQLAICHAVTNIVEGALPCGHRTKVQIDGQTLRGRGLRCTWPSFSSHTLRTRYHGLSHDIERILSRCAMA